MDQVKGAFDKVKYDINFLREQIIDIKKELSEIQNSIIYLINAISTHNSENSTLRHINSTHNNSSTHNSSFKDSKTTNIHSSIGNEGVSTDRQTDRQTDTKPQKPLVQQTDTSIKDISKNNQHIETNLSPNPSLVLEQLDNLKKGIRIKFKRLTSQEMLVFSTIYQFEDQNQQVDYSLLSSKLNLSQSSIRDYVQRIVDKGIPLIKEKINNKRIILHISPDLKKLATLDTLISLRQI